MIGITTITYHNHFDNSFHFDDYHTIKENPNIRTLSNVFTFFKDGSTISSLPQNQSYRPIVATSLAFDYWLGNGYNPFYFHLTTFILFIFLGILIFFFSKKIVDISLKNTINFYVASTIVLWYMLHPVMAETVNYIIARSDLQSTFFVVLAFVIYQYSPFAKKYHLYLIPVGIGVLSKPLAIMFASLFFCYVLLFEQKMSFLDIFSKKSIKKTIQLIKYTIPSIVFCILLYIFHHEMTPEGFSTGSSRTYNYLISQPYVITYYLGSIFFPVHLSADTDWTVLENIWSYKFLIGILVIITLVNIAFLTSKKKIYRPISFGIAWFFIVLVPTSSIIPLAEVMNDHRMFFPYVGLIISVTWTIHLLIQYAQKKYNFTNIYITTFVCVLLLIYAFGTYQRNEVWHNDESLWKDVTIKSPKNGRGLMNYGLTQMTKGEYKIAEQYFKKALEFNPYYYTLHTNLGILNGAQGNSENAEIYFKKAIKYGANYHSSWFYYGRFLSQNSRNKEATSKLLKSLELSPFHIETRVLLMENYLESENWEELNKLAIKTLDLDRTNIVVQQYLKASKERIGKLEIEEKVIAKNPTAAKYIDLSFKYYQKKQYQKCIDFSKKALEINPKFHEAYNNICSAQNLLGNYDEAIKACNKSLEINPDFELAKTNRNDAINRKRKTEELALLLEQKPTEENFLNIGLLYYNYGLFKKCIITSEQTIKSYPNSSKAYNNLCASYNSLKKWNKAIEAGKKGLAIDPKNQLLRNNYNWALKNK